MRLASIALSLVTVCVTFGADTAAAAAPATGDPAIEISIEKHAQLTADGGVTFRVHVTCGPLPGTHDFREGHAGAGQARTGAGAEGGLSPDVQCDGDHRVYTADVSLITESPFRPGPARASASVIACNVVGDDQVCVHGATERKVIVQGRTQQ